MTTIHSCKFETSPITNITSVQKNGAHDISSLVQAIVTKDFKYTGTSRFSLKLRPDKMVLIIDGKKQKLTATEQGWASAETHNRLAETLSRIGKAYTPLIDNGKGKEEADEVMPDNRAYLRELEANAAALEATNRELHDALLRKDREPSDELLKRQLAKLQRRFNELQEEARSQQAKIKLQERMLKQRS